MNEKHCCKMNLWMTLKKHHHFACCTRTKIFNFKSMFNFIQNWADLFEWMSCFGIFQVVVALFNILEQFISNVSWKENQKKRVIAMKWQVAEMQQSSITNLSTSLEFLWICFCFYTISITIASSSLLSWLVLFSKIHIDSILPQQTNIWILNFFPVQ